MGKSIGWRRYYGIISHDDNYRRRKGGRGFEFIGDLNSGDYKEIWINGKKYVVPSKYDINPNIDYNNEINKIIERYKGMYENGSPEEDDYFLSSKRESLEKFLQQRSAKDADYNFDHSTREWIYKAYARDYIAEAEEIRKEYYGTGEIGSEAIRRRFSWLQDLYYIALNTSKFELNSQGLVSEASLRNAKIGGVRGGRDFFDRTQAGSFGFNFDYNLNNQISRMGEELSAEQALLQAGNFIYNNYIFSQVSSRQEKVIQWMSEQERLQNGKKSNQFRVLNERDSHGNRYQNSYNFGHLVEAEMLTNIVANFESMLGTFQSGYSEEEATERYQRIALDLLPKVGEQADAGLILPDGIKAIKQLASTRENVQTILKLRQSEGDNSQMIQDLKTVVSSIMQLDVKNQAGGLGSVESLIQEQSEYERNQQGGRGRENRYVNEGFITSQLQSALRKEFKQEGRGFSIQLSADCSSKEEEQYAQKEIDKYVQNPDLLSEDIPEDQLYSLFFDALGMSDIFGF